MTQAQYLGRRATVAEKNAIAAAKKAEEEARLGKIYGRLLPDVLFLRSRGFVIVKEGGRLTIGGRDITAEDLQAKAARERRLAGVPQPTSGRSVTKTASGLRVGAVVPIAARQAKASPLLSTAKQKAPATPKAQPKPRVPEHSTDLGDRPRVVWLDLALLKVDGSYQREVGEGGRTHINRIVKAFNWNCYQPIVVTERDDGSFAVIDGQHRLEAAKKHPLIDSLPCYIIAAPDVAVQASIFVSINTQRLALTSQAKFWAAHAAGIESAVALVEICRAVGVTVLRSPPHGSAPPLSLLAPLVGQRLIERHGQGAVREAIALLAAAQPQTTAAFRSHFVEALVRIAADPAYSRDRAGAVLAKIDLVQLQAEIVVRSGGGGGGRATAAEQILRARFGMAGKPANGVRGER
jgi:hypothetical protein